MAEEIIQIANEAEQGRERAKQATPNQNDQGEKIDVHRRKIGSVTIYDVTEAELNVLEKGTDASVWLNFLIFTISTAISFMVSLLTVEWEESVSVVQITFICVTVIMTISALICFVFWRRGRGQHLTTIKAIKERTVQANC